jgi:regulatory protein
MDVALRYLARRARSVAEVRRHLSARGYGAAEAEEAVARLLSWGYLDDEAFALRYAAWAAADRPMGRLRIVADLLKRGVDAAAIDRALAAGFGSAVERAALEKALQRAARRLEGRPDAAARRRLGSHLIRRGFRPAAVMAAVDAWCRARGRAAGDDDLEGEVEDV